MQETALYREQWHYEQMHMLNSQYLYCVRRPINTSTMALVSHSCVKSSAWCGVVLVWCSGVVWISLVLLSSCYTTDI